MIKKIGWEYYRKINLKEVSKQELMDLIIDMVNEDECDGRVELNGGDYGSSCCDEIEWFMSFEEFKNKYENMDLKDIVMDLVKTNTL